jgi:ribonuclease P protein component
VRESRALKRPPSPPRKARRPKRRARKPDNRPERTQSTDNFLNQYETPISAIKNQAPASAWFYEPQFHQEWARDFIESPPRWAQAVNAGLIPRLILGGQAPAEKPRGFSRNQRLKETWEFERARRNGNRLAKGCLLLNWLSRPITEGQKERTGPRLGVVTSKRIGNAVVRSRARRLLREAFRVHQHELDPSADLVLVARQSIAGKGFNAVSRDFMAALKQARLLRTGE